MPAPTTAGAVEEDEEEALERRMQEMEEKRRDEVEHALRHPLEKVLCSLDMAGGSRRDRAAAAQELSVLEIKMLEEAESSQHQNRAEGAEERLLGEMLSRCRTDPRIHAQLVGQSCLDSYAHCANMEEEQALKEEVESERQREEEIEAQEMARHDKAWAHHLWESERKRNLRRAVRGEVKLGVLQEECRSLHEEESAVRSNFEESHLMEAIARSEEVLVVLRVLTRR
eukprot:752200-Hanusia_phi.AAC.4